MRKIAIVGAGRVGESTAHNLAKHELCREIVLIDVKEGVPQGTALDIQESAPIFDFDTKLRGSNSLDDMADAEMVIITAGVPRKQGMSRSDVLETNVAVINGVVDAAVKQAPNALLLLVTNPVDILTYAAWRRTGWSRHRVFGMAGVLDSARMGSFVAMETGFSVKDISAMVLGGHGDTLPPSTAFPSSTSSRASRSIASSSAPARAAPRFLPFARPVAPTMPRPRRSRAWWMPSPAIASTSFRPLPFSMASTD